MVIAVDFDGTIVEHKYPAIGRELPFATETLRMLIRDRHKLILWSVREGRLLDEAVEWCRGTRRGVLRRERDYPEESREHDSFSRKLKADLFIDDRNIGGLPDWGTIYQMVRDRSTWEEVLEQRNSSFEKTEARSARRNGASFKLPTML